MKTKIQQVRDIQGSIFSADESWHCVCRFFTFINQLKAWLKLEKQIPVNDEDYRTDPTIWRIAPSRYRDPMAVKPITGFFRIWFVQILLRRSMATGRWQTFYTEICICKNLAHILFFTLQLLEARYQYCEDFRRAAIQCRRSGLLGGNLKPASNHAAIVAKSIMIMF
jgi:hypothetical protein